MCKFCEPILGKGCLPHTEDECALKQSAYCPLCGRGQHFQDQCPKQARRKLGYGIPVIKTVSSQEQKPALIMSGRTEEYNEYLKRAGQTKAKKGEAERLVREDLGSRGMVLQTTPLTLYRSLPSAEAPCGIQHPLNKDCCAKK